MVNNKTTLSSLFLGTLLLFTSGILGVSHGSTEVAVPSTMEETEETSVLSSVVLRTEASSQTAQLETADSVLIQRTEWQWNRYVKDVLQLPNWLDLGLEHRTRFEAYDHPWRSTQPLGRTDPQIQQRSRMRLGLNGGPFKLLFEGQDARVHLDDKDSFVNTGIKNEMDILQAFVSVSLENVFNTGLRTDLHFGRLTMDVGSRRLIARNLFRNTTNAFDGFHWQLAHDHLWRTRAFLVQPVLIDPTQLDEHSKRNVFWGTYVEMNHLSWLRFSAYYFGLNDQRSSIISSQRTFSTFGLRLHKTPVSNQLDYELETVWQTGKRGDTDHFAHFQHLNLGYTFNLLWSPRLVIHYDYASGDRNPNDSRDSAFDTLFGARRFEYMPTGNFGSFFRTNISSPGWRVIVTPTKGWKFQVKHRIWYLATSRGAFGNNGLRDSTGESGTFLGHDVEVTAQWNMNENVSFDAGYDHWFKGSYFDRLPARAGLPPGGEKDTDYFYILTTIRL